eukprot:2109847-Alexandrium_andersonii.AAC.1
MSASLVGSEMCIRDSLCIEQEAVRQDPGDRPMDSAELDPRQHQDGDPVSYTHLTLPTICSV